MKTQLRQKNPLRADMLYVECGSALAAAAGSAGRGSRAVGISERLFRDWISGAQSSPFGRALEALIHLPDPFPIAKLFNIHAIKSLLRMNDDQLVARFFDVLEQATAAESLQIQSKVSLARNRDLAGLMKYSATESHLDEKLAAVSGELIERGIDPWTFAARRAQ